jgi:hypothetical protein
MNKEFWNVTQGKELLIMLLTSCVTLKKAFHFSGPQCDEDNKVGKMSYSKNYLLSVLSGVVLRLDIGYSS